MPTIKLPTGQTVVSLGSDADARGQQRLIDARHAFVIEYCRSKGWPEDPEKLSIDQILEMREQSGWKSPLAADALQVER